MPIQSQLTEARAFALTESGLWANRLIIDHLDEVAVASPDKLAIVEHNSETNSVLRLDYGELARRSKTIALNLLALGVRAGDIVAIQLPNWWHYAAVHCACVRIGAVTNPLMPIFRERELTFMLGFAEARVLITAQTFRGFDYPSMLSAIRSDLPSLDHLIVVNSDSTERDFDHVLLAPTGMQEAEQDAALHEHRQDPNDVTEIIYTSGTTGKPNSWR